MSLAKYTYESSSDSNDDLEKTLVLAAAAADSVNTSAYTENLSENSPNDDVPQETKTVDHLKPGHSAKRSYEDEDDSNSYEASRRHKIQKSSMPDTSQGYANVVATHYNTLEEKGLDERSKSRIVHMRNFHNWIKSMLINEYLTKIKDGKKHNAPVLVLDMCCGKGGDLLKWKKGSISHLICSDIASISLDQCKTRYEDMKARNNRERNPGKIYAIEYIPGDCSRARLREKYRDPSIKLDLVSCQFAFHYSFESLPQAECMLRNASECLAPGGFFIGTMPDANELIARVRKSDGRSFGNDVYQVVFDFPTDRPPLFGARYNFHLDGVVDCPEFLVHFPTFIKLAKKYGLKFVKKEKFYDFYLRMKDEGRTLMQNMNCLESYPPSGDAKPIGTSEDDYTHADDYISKYFADRNEKATIGTLSKSEWEASSLYLTFVFVKVKNTWNSDGTPRFEI